MAKSVGEANDIRAEIGTGKKGGMLRTRRDPHFREFAHEGSRQAPLNDITAAKKEYAGNIKAAKDAIKAIAAGLRSPIQVLDENLEGRTPTTGSYVVIEWSIRPAGPVDDMIETDGAACGCGCGCGCGG